ncbi:39S ribosomal protein L28, mitochondrial [Camponotus floridanus]|uniref:39S ribosomal protein L28, mitochondrial n=1 Tax=Camponotus floridanus TaxID=104421 RepID=E2AA41_CAMFO|nr:39S ribosomal protein L28, mitochondrial [Camponotus floridanus]
MSAKEAGQRLYYYARPTRWSKGIGAELPVEYKKFWKEWKKKPAAVHYIEQKSTYVKNNRGEVYPVQNVPLPLLYPKEIDNGIWGGEAIVQGFKKKDKTLYPDNPEKREEVYAKYEKYLSLYTRDEIEWYGLTYLEALKKWLKLNETTPQPLKIQYRSELIAKLKENKIKEAENVDVVLPEQTSSWLNKLNPFSKSPKTK